ncbi:MAG: response regulator [Rectinema subterraneum]|uniref:response regulator transcription factor n=1 Tax=Rectinema subterraneum TaxID=2653714 RepID=UPI003C7D0BD3
MGKLDKKVRTFSALEIAKLCGVVNQTAINWIRAGHLKAFTTPGGQYRVYAEDLVTFLKERDMRIPEELHEDLTMPVDLGLVLIVDDDKDLNTILKRLLERKIEELRVAQAFDGFEAGRIIAERHPAIVLLDLNLPGVDGFSLCKKIRSDESFGQPAVIAMTGIAQEEAQPKMMEAGADAFFAKPLNFDALIAKIRELLEARKNQQEKIEE